MFVRERQSNDERTKRNEGGKCRAEFDLFGFVGCTRERERGREQEKDNKLVMLLLLLLLLPLSFGQLLIETQSG